jgi:hypothetical protein
MMYGMVIRANFFTVVEKEDLVNLLMRHAGNSPNSNPRSDFSGHPGGQADTQIRDLSSMMEDQSEQCLQEQSGFTATHLPAQCCLSTAETLHNNDYLVNSFYNNTRHSGKTNCYFSLTAAFCIGRLV